MIESLRQKFRGRIHEVGMGRDKQVIIGGDTGLPMHAFEATSRRPLVSLEITDRLETWPEQIHSRLYGTENVRSWARCCEEAGADLICFSLAGPLQQSIPEYRDAAASAVVAVSQTVSLPICINGTGDREVDNMVLPEIARVLSGLSALIGPVTEHNYQDIARACLDYGHTVMAQSPIDINIAKQINILLSDMGMPLSRIVMDPTTGGLGYGIEYTYSIIEKARLAALGGDRMLGCPVVCFVGQENWKLKEASTEWEATAAIALVMAGAHIVVVRDRATLNVVKRLTESLLHSG